MGIYMGQELSSYIEKHLQLQLESCDYASESPKHFFRIYFNFMVIQDLKTSLVRKVRRIECTPKVHDPAEGAKNVSNWTEVPLDSLSSHDKCSICLSIFTEDAEEDISEDEDIIVQLSKCGPHYFHKSCIVECYSPPQESNQSVHEGHLKCPICSHIYGIQTGTMPFGTMKVTRHQNSLFFPSRDTRTRTSFSGTTVYWNCSSMLSTR